MPDALVVHRAAADELADVAAARAIAAASTVVDASGAGRVALVAAPERIGAVRRALAAAGQPSGGGAPADSDDVDLDAPLVVLTPVQAKGLEFDVVVLVEPADLAPGDLYVAMTRPTAALHVVHAAPLPAGLRPEQ